MDQNFPTLINGGGPLCTIQRFKAKCDEALSNFAFTFSLRRYNKDVRKAILGSLAVSDHTIPFIVERTRDLSEDVRRVAFLALTSKVPVASVSIALRATALRRGLAAGAYTRPLFSSTCASCGH
jgi:hypothetical protein